MQKLLKNDLASRYNWMGRRDKLSFRGLRLCGVVKELTAPVADTMNGQRFVEVLRRLGHPGADQLLPQSFDWIFEQDKLLPFLDWFCEDLTPSNLLSPDEVAKFAELQQSQEGILEKEHLELALETTNNLEEETLSAEKLRDDIDHLKGELQFCQQTKDILLQQRNNLSLHHTCLTDRVAKLDDLENVAKMEYKRCLEQGQGDNSKVNNTLDGLILAVSQLIALYQETTAVSSTDHYLPDIAVFLSQVDLDKYHKAEEKFTEALTAFTKKQFFQGISDMAGGGESCKYEFLEISNPDLLLVRGEKEDVVLDDCKELARLQAFYPKGESQRVNSITEEKSTLAACEFVEQRLGDLKEKPYSQDVDKLSKKLEIAQTQLSIMRKDTSLLAEDQIPHLIKDSAALLVTKILRGDYDLKLSRQDYFTSNQDQVVNQLLIQKARHEFLALAYEIESQRHREVHSLITALIMLLQKNAKAAQCRMEMMKDSSLQPDKRQRSTVDSRDQFLIKIHQLLEEDKPFKEQQQQLFLTYNQMCQQAAALHQQVTSARSSISASISNQEDGLAVLESSLKAGEGALFSGSSTDTQPMSCPRSVSDALQQLQDLSRRLEEVVTAVIKDVENKKKILKTDPLQATERELFVSFFNNPDKLRRAVDDVTTRLQAVMVK